MLFNSIAFLIFFPIVFVLFYALPQRVRWVLLLGASYFFYMWWKWEFIFLLLISTCVDYFAGLGIAATENPRRRKLLLGLSLLSNLGMLFYFKYIGFFADLANDVLASGEGAPRIIPNLHPLLPVGISFYTFQTLGYTIDVYRGTLKPEKHFGYFGLYVAYFPQLVAGPIERAGNLLPQLRKKIDFKYDEVMSGLRMVIAGMFKKVVIADSLAVLVNNVHVDVTQHSGLTLFVATVCFTFQLFCDFSGYSDIAVGLARMLGVDIIRNFDRPFFTKNLSHFWRRTHTSLGLWFREYLYIPLGGNRHGQTLYFRNIFIVFLLSGFWHGASWNYIVWGASQAAFFVVGTLTEPLRAGFVRLTGLDRTPRLLAGLQHVKVFTLYTTSMIFFRCRTLDDAWHVFGHIGDGLFGQLFDLEAWRRVLSLGESVPKMLIIFGMVAIMETIHGMAVRFPTDKTVAGLPAPLRWTIYLVLVMGMLLFGQFSGAEFLYFQF